jgi:hypothetical protein
LPDGHEVAGMARSYTYPPGSMTGVHRQR